MQLGFKLACENRSATTLVAEAHRAEQAGFDFAFVSDHYHPWTREQGQSPLVWSVIAAAAQATDELSFVTGVTCPTMRLHPAIVAQAAATSATLLPGRFRLGVGTGENLNEHILGDHWPDAAERREMLEEAVAVMRRLWSGGQVTHRGDHYTVETAQLFSLPETPPPVYVASSGPGSARLAGEIGDGLVLSGPEPELLDIYRQAGGTDPVYGEVPVAYGPDAETAVREALRWWPKVALSGELAQELPTPAHMEQALEDVERADIASSVACGPDPERHVAAIREYTEAGFTHVAVNQVVPGVEGVFDFYAEEVLPRL